MTMHYRGYRSHDAGERLSSRREPEAQGTKMVNHIPHAKPQVTARSWMYRNLKVGILEVQGYHPVSWPERLENGLGSLHVKMGELHPPVEAREIDDRSPTPGDFGGDKEATVKPRRRRCDLDGLLLHQGGHLVRQSQPPDGIGAVAGKGEWNRGERGHRTVRDPIPVAQDLDYPSIGSPRLPDLPMFCETPPNLARRGTWFLSAKTPGGLHSRRSRRVKPDSLRRSRGRARLPTATLRRRRAGWRTGRAEPATLRTGTGRSDIY